MPDVIRAATWSTYQAAWADTKPTEQPRLLGASLTEGCVYTDSIGVWEGREAIIRRIEQVCSDMPGTI